MRLRVKSEIKKEMAGRVTELKRGRVLLQQSKQAGSQKAEIARVRTGRSDEERSDGSMCTLWETMFAPKEPHGVRYWCSAAVGQRAIFRNYQEKLGSQQLF